MKKLKILAAILFVIIFFNCKKDNPNVSIEEQNNNKNSERLTDTLQYDIVKNLKVDESETVFETGKFRFTYNSENGSFDLFENNLKLKNINFDNRDYDGPGFLITLFESKININKKIFIIEATADIGTEWYYSIILENRRVIKSFFIDEPKSNSDNYNIDKFINISSINDSFIFRFDKNLILKNSKIPSDFKSDSKYIYLNTSIKNSPTDINNNPNDYKKNVEKAGFYRFILEKKMDLNLDGFEDNVLVFKNNKEFSSDDEESKKSPIVIFLNKGNGMYQKFENSTIYSNDSNDFFGQIVVKDNFITIEINNEVPNEYVIDKFITFKYDKVINEPILFKYGENISGNKNEKKLFTNKNFGLIKFGEYNSNTIFEKCKK